MLFRSGTKLFKVCPFGCIVTFSSKNARSAVDMRKNLVAQSHYVQKNKKHAFPVHTHTLKLRTNSTRAEAFFFLGLFCTLTSLEPRISVCTCVHGGRCSKNHVE